MQELVTNEQFEAALRDNRPLVVDCGAKWCGPCRVAHEELEKLASAYPQVRICSVDIDNEDVSDATDGVTKVPTIRVYHAGEVVREKIGADGLAELIESAAVLARTTDN